MIVMCPHCGGLNRIQEAKLSSNPICGKCKKELFTQSPVSMNEEQFTRAIEKTDQIFVVDFWAEWCGPCKAFAPTFSQAAKQLDSHIRLVKINTESERNLSAKFNIRSIPTLAIFKEGKEVTRISGALPLNDFVSWVNQNT